MRKPSCVFLPLVSLLFSLWTAGCSDQAADPIEPFLPALPEPGGPVVCRAGRLTEENFAKERVQGPAAQGTLGDYFLANDKIRVVIQRPGRSISPVPYGGNIIDGDLATEPQGDQFGEVGLFLLTGRTANFTTSEVVRDGSLGGPAVLRFRGGDVLNDYINVGALGSIAGLISEALKAENRLGLRLAVTYILQPGASHVEAIYTFYNPSNVEVLSNWGTITDSGAQVSLYHPGLGFGELSFTSLLAANVPLVEYMAQRGQGLSYGIVPQAPEAGRGAVAFPIAGVAVEIYDAKGKFDVFNDKGLTVTLAPQGAAERRFSMVVAKGGVDGVEQVVRAEVRKQPLVTIRGRVQGTVPGERLQVGLARAGEPAPYNAYTALSLLGGPGDSTDFTTSVLPGAYNLRAEGEGPRQGAQVTLTASEGAMANLAIPAPARIAYRIVDEAKKPIAGKISIIGQAPAPLAFVDAPDERDVQGLVLTHASLRGDSTLGDRFDHPLSVPPGTYRIVVSHGPEWTRHEEKLTLVAGQMVTVNADLYHVIDTTGYVASDFHQHTMRSPDSTILLEDRVARYLAEGVDFISSSDHDVITDYKPTIAALGAKGLLDAVPGDELTPFGYGHFIAWPLRYDPLSPNGGAFDWGGGEEPNIAPAGIFAGARALGAKVVQINHPRAKTVKDLDFQQNFDRAALRFDFTKRTFFGDQNAMPVPAALLGLPENAEVFSDRFDALEIMNGAAPTPPDRDGERRDVLVDRVLRDWMNFLSFGLVTTATGTSDSHGLVVPSGLPRSWVRVRDDSAAAIAVGIGEEVARTVSGEGGTPRDVIVSNTPFMTFYVDDPQKGGIGHTIAPKGTSIRITAEVRTPQWAPIDTLEIFANATFDKPNGNPEEALVPTLCYSSQPMLSERCRMATLSGPLTIQRMDAGGGRVYLLARISVDVDLDVLLRRNREGAKGKDLWLVARAFGGQSIFPVMPGSISDKADLTALIDGKPLRDSGVFPLAFTNPIFIDADGNGWRGPFQP